MADEQYSAEARSSSTNRPDRSERITPLLDEPARRVVFKAAVSGFALGALMSVTIPRLDPIYDALSILLTLIGLPAIVTLSVRHELATQRNQPLHRVCLLNGFLIGSASGVISSLRFADEFIIGCGVVAGTVLGICSAVLAWNWVTAVPRCLRCGLDWERDETRYSRSSTWKRCPGCGLRIPRRFDLLPRERDSGSSP